MYYRTKGDPKATASQRDEQNSPRNKSHMPYPAMLTFSASTTEPVATVATEPAARVAEAFILESGPKLVASQEGSMA